MTLKSRMFTPSPNNPIFDYTADGVKRSIEGSSQRRGVDALDIVFVHDLSPDNPNLPIPWAEQFEIARKGASLALTRMCQEGIIIGVGMAAPGSVRYDLLVSIHRLLNGIISEADIPNPTFREFAGPFAMGWIKDHTGSYAGGLLLRAALGIMAMGTLLMIGQDKVPGHIAAAE
jgi:hypothetical protein